MFEMLKMPGTTQEIVSNHSDLVTVFAIFSNSVGRAETRMEGDRLNLR